MTKVKAKIFSSLLFCLILFSIPLIGAQPTLNLTVSTDKQAYCGFNVVTISGALQNNGVASNNGLVGLQVQDSNGNILIIRTLKTGIANPPSLPAQISAYLSDQSEHPQSSIQAGALSYFTTNLVNNDNLALSMLITINLFDSDGIPIGQISEQCSLLSEKTGSAILSIQIPNWAHTGTAYGYANIYTDCA